MNIVLIFVVIYIAMFATSFWEAYSEGRRAWNKGKLGWQLRLPGGYVLPAYHFYLFGVMFPALLSLPLITGGWDLQLFKVLLSAYISGLVLEDFMWFVVNPKVSLDDWNPTFANYYPWITFKRFRIPLGYVLGLALSCIIFFS